MQEIDASDVRVAAIDVRVAAITNLIIGGTCDIMQACGGMK